VPSCIQRLVAEFYPLFYSENKFLMRILLRLFLLFLVIGFNGAQASAQALRHGINSLDNSDSWQSKRQCYKLLDRQNSMYCLPVSTLRVLTGQITFDSSFNSNEEGYTIISRFSDKKVDREFLESLFSNNNFQTFSGVARFSAIYGETTFSLVPYHFVGAFKISNPSLPEIKMAAITGSHLLVSHNFVFSNVGPYNFLVSPILTIASKEAISGDFNVLELATLKQNDVIKSEKWVEPNASIATGLLSRRPFLPSLTLRANNVIEKEHCKECRISSISVDEEIKPFANATLGFYSRLGYGKLWCGVSGRFLGLFADLDMLTSGGLVIYKLGFLDTFVALAPAVTSFGFMFDSNLYRVGIQYTDEKQDNNLQIMRRKHSYVHLGFKI